MREREPEHAANARFLQPTEHSVRKLVVEHRVGEIEHRGDARIHRFHTAKKRARVRIFRAIDPLHGLHDELRPQGGHHQGTQVRHPRMAMTIDEPGQHHFRRGVHDLGIRSRQVPADGCDRAAFDENVAVLHVADGSIHGDDVTALDENSRLVGDLCFASRR